MDKAEIKLAAAFLEMAAEEFSSHSCNDIPMEIEKLLTQEEWATFNVAHQKWNGDKEVLWKGGPDPNLDAAWMHYLAKRLKSLL